MDKKKSILNISTSISLRIVTVILSIIVKRLLIRACGNEVNGLNALYLSIIGFLTVAELGVGSAIIFCMYKPIVDGDKDKVSALYHLFRRIYNVIGLVILVAGLAITPFIQYFAKDYAQLNVNMYLTFVLILVSVVITYLFGAKSSLINAYKDNYITTAIASGGTVIQYLLQIATLMATQSFVCYLCCRIVAALAQWLVTEIVVHKKHREILNNKQKLDKGTKNQLSRSIKAMFMHKVGTLLVNTVDSVVISAFVGVVALGEYSNYTSLQVSMDGIIALVFASLTTIFGHLYVQKSKQTTKAYFKAFHLINYVVGTVCYLGYFAIVDNLIAILLSETLVVEKAISFVITVNGFVQFMRQNTLTFRDATGAFYNDRWKPLVEGIVNIILSITFVKLIGVTGVIVATILTNLLICHVIEPYVLYKNAFCESPKKHYIDNYSMIAIFIAALFLLNSCLQSFDDQWTELLVNGFISVGVSLLACAVVMLTQWKTCKHIVMKLFKKKQDGSSD